MNNQISELSETLDSSLPVPPDPPLDIPTICPIIETNTTANNINSFTRIDIEDCPEDQVPLADYKSTLDSFLCTSDPGGMDKLLQMIEDGEELGQGGPIPGIECIQKGDYLGEEKHAELLSWVNLG